jgi:hypothetical protein
MAERSSHPVELDRSRDSYLGSSDVPDAAVAGRERQKAIGWEAFDITGGGA